MAPRPLHSNELAELAALSKAFASKEHQRGLCLRGLLYQASRWKTALSATCVGELHGEYVFHVLKKCRKKHVLRIKTQAIWRPRYGIRSVTAVTAVTAVIESVTDETDGVRVDSSEGETRRGLRNAVHP